MPPRPPYVQGHYYHFYNRGAHRVSIFREADNYVFVVRKLKYYCHQLDVTPIAYCLMPNHYHVLVRQEGDHPAGLLPQRIFNSYTKAYNKRYDHSGTLFEGNYRVVAIETTSHLLGLCRYIHANPVKDGIVDDVAEWSYSNYLEWVQARGGTLVDRAFVEQYYPTADAYRQAVQAYLDDRESIPALAYVEDTGGTHF